MLEMLLFSFIGILSVILFAIGIGYLTESEELYIKEKIHSYLGQEEAEVHLIYDKDQKHIDTKYGVEEAITNYGEGSLAAVSKKGVIQLNVYNVAEALKNVGVYKDKLKESLVKVLPVLGYHEAAHHKYDTSSEVFVQTEAYIKGLEEKNAEGVDLAHKLMERVNPTVAKAAEDVMTEEASGNIGFSYKPKSIQKEKEVMERLYSLEPANKEVFTDDRKVVGQDWNF